MGAVLITQPNVLVIQWPKAAILGFPPGQSSMRDSFSSSESTHVIPLPSCTRTRTVVHVTLQVLEQHEGQFQFFWVHSCDAIAFMYTTPLMWCHCLHVHNTTHVMPLPSCTQHAQGHHVTLQVSEQHEGQFQFFWVQACDAIVCACYTPSVCHCCACYTPSVCLLERPDGQSCCYTYRAIGLAHRGRVALNGRGTTFRCDTTNSWVGWRSRNLSQERDCCLQEDLTKVNIYIYVNTFRICFPNLYFFHIIWHSPFWAYCNRHVVPRYNSVVL